MNRRKRGSIIIESPKNSGMPTSEQSDKSDNSDKSDIIDIKNENIYLMDEAYGKLNEYPSPKNRIVIK